MNTVNINRFNCIFNENNLPIVAFKLKLIKIPMLMTKTIGMSLSIIYSISIYRENNI